MPIRIVMMILLALFSFSCASYNEDTENIIPQEQEVPSDYISPAKMFDIADDRIRTGDTYQVIAERHNVKYEDLLKIINTERYQKRYQEAKKKLKKEILESIDD